MVKGIYDMQGKRNTVKYFAAENAIELTEVSAVWDSNFSDHTLKDITLNIKSGSLCAVVGAVGAGKVCMLLILLFIFL